mmetsp:Transcript_6995/g.11128  ORF Transcript_6995/g.11128 Transcript_6995/m.11128 type:complete len:570 (-) Transcript_6995:548-2257(-)
MLSAAQPQSSNCACKVGGLDEELLGNGASHSACCRADIDEIGDVLDSDDGEEFGRHGFKLRELWKFTGPAWMVSIAYLDPGNLEVDLQAGAQFGYTLSWVLLWSSVLGLVIQILALRLGIVTRRHLAEHCRDEYPKPLRYLLWVLSELMIVASDVPEVIGTAFAIQILSGNTIPLYAGVLLCSFSTVIFLALTNLGLTFLTVFIGLLVGVMSACFVAECVLSPPDAAATISGTFIPFLPAGSENIAVGLLGAVAMPHNLFLQSALVLSKGVKRERRSIEYACKYTSIETAIALLVSFFINTSVLLVAASSFAPHWCEASEQVCEGSQSECSAAPSSKCFEVGLETAGILLQKMVGPRASTLWAVALLASGQSSTITGTYAGQFVMQGFVELTMPLWARNLISRLVAIVPSLMVAIIAGPKGANELIVTASIVLSLHLPLALVPLLKFTDSPLKMGNCCNSRLVSALAWLLTAIVVVANMFLVWTSAIGPLVLHPKENLVQLASWTTAIIFYVSLLGYLTFAPVVRRSSLPDCIFAGDRSALAVATQITAPLLHTRQPETPNEFVESVDQ